MNNSTTQRKIIGWSLVILVGLGACIPQLLGKPYIIGHMWEFKWTYGFPWTFSVCDGLKRPSSPAVPVLRDETDSHWTTRLLVPVIARPHEYPARTGVFLTSNPRVLKFNVYCLLLDIFFVLVILSGALYLKYRIVNAPSLYVYTIRLMAVLALLCMAYYVYLILTWDSHVCIALYYPPILAFNGLGIFCVIMSLSLIFRQNDANKKSQQGG